MGNRKTVLSFSPRCETGRKSEMDFHIGVIMQKPKRIVSAFLILWVVEMFNTLFDGQVID